MIDAARQLEQVNLLSAFGHSDCNLRKFVDSGQTKKQIKTATEMVTVLFGSPCWTRTIIRCLRARFWCSSSRTIAHKLKGFAFLKLLVRLRNSQINPSSGLRSGLQPGA